MSSKKNSSNKKYKTVKKRLGEPCEKPEECYTGICLEGVCTGITDPRYMLVQNQINRNNVVNQLKEIKKMNDTNEEGITVN